MSVAFVLSTIIFPESQTLLYMIFVTENIVEFSIHWCKIPLKWRNITNDNPVVFVGDAKRKHLNNFEMDRKVGTICVSLFFLL